MRYLNVVWIALFAWMGTQCSFPYNDAEIGDEIVLTDSVSDQFNHELGTVRKNIEQCAGLYTRLYELKCPYSPDLPLPQNEAYELTPQKAISFGGYAASFVYSASYQQAQEAANYLDFILRLSEDLGIRNAFDQDELKQLLSNNSEIDKSAIITRVYLRATEQLYTEERAILVCYMVVGGWVEGMKMTYESCGDYLDDEEIRLGIYDQTYTYYNCKRILSTFKDDKKAKKLLDKLLVLEPVIDEVVKTRGDISRDLFSRLHTSLIKMREEIYL